MVRFATYDDIPALKHIREVCFDEGAAYSDFYFATRFTAQNTLVHVEEGRPVSTLTLLDAEIATTQRVFPIAYIYSVATLPEWRRRGLAAALMQHADSYLQSQGVEASLLAPASAQLFDYYAKLGYETKFYIEKYNSTHPAIETDTVLQVKDLKAGDYFRLRKEAYAAGSYYVQWNSEALDFALQECRLVGGLAWHICTEAAEGFLLAYPLKDNTVIIKECSLGGSLYPLALRMLQQTFGAHRQYIFYGMPRPESTSALAFAMIKHYTAAAQPEQGTIPYFGLAKD